MHIQGNCVNKLQDRKISMTATTSHALNLIDTRVNVDILS